MRIETNIQNIRLKKLNETLVDSEVGNGDMAPGIDLHYYRERFRNVLDSAFFIFYVAAINPKRKNQRIFSKGYFYKKVLNLIKI